MEIFGVKATCLMSRSKFDRLTILTQSIMLYGKLLLKIYIEDCKIEMSSHQSCRQVSEKRVCCPIGNSIALLFSPNQLCFTEERLLKIYINYCKIEMSLHQS